MGASPNAGNEFLRVKRYKPYVCCPHVIKRACKCRRREFSSVSEPTKQVDGARNPNTISVFVGLGPTIIDPDNIRFSCGELHEVEKYRFCRRRLVFLRNWYFSNRLWQYCVGSPCQAVANVLDKDAKPIGVGIVNCGVVDFALILLQFTCGNNENESGRGQFEDICKSEQPHDGASAHQSLGSGNRCFIR